MINGNPPFAGGGNVHSSSAAILDSALDALRGEQPNDFSPSQLTNFLVSLLSDNAPDKPLLEQKDRRRLLQAVVERVGPDGLTQVLHHALPNLRIHPSKTIAAFLTDLGPVGLPNVEVARAILARFGLTESSPPNEQSIGDIVGGLLSVNSDSIDGEAPTNVVVLIRALTTFSRYISWARTIRLLDEPEGLTIPSNVRWDTLANLLLTTPQEGQISALTGLWDTWAHRSRQLQILSGLASLDPEQFTFVMLPGRRVVAMDDTANASQSIRILSSSLQNSTWNSLDLIETLAMIAEWEDDEIQSAVTALMEKAVKNNAELLLMGLVQLPQPWSSLHQDLSTKLVSMFLAGHPSHQIVFYRIWQSNRSFLLEAFRRFYSENGINVARILDVAQDLKILDALLDIRPFTLALDLAALASRREYLNLEKWLQSSISLHGNDFIRTALEFLDNKVKDDLSRQDPQAEHKFILLTVSAVATFLRVLRSNGDSMSAEEIDYFKVVRNLCLQLHPRLMNLAPGSEGQEPGLHVVTFSQDIHKEVDGFYRQMYEEQITIEELVGLLQRTKVSDDARDRQVFACMVHTLFDEYRCFEMDYPPRELAMTAIVFGSLIQYQLIDFIPLGIAIRYVLDALRNPPESNMFKFGLQALLRFQDRLPEWPQLGHALLSLPHVQQSHPDIARMVRAAVSGQATNGGVASSQLNGSGEDAKVPFTAINVEPLLNEGEKIEPDEDLSDKILFIVNNLSPMNLEAKLVDARKLLKPDLHPWFSSYLVLQRVSIEPNNHTLYTDFLDGLDGSTSLLNYVLHETYAKVKMLLNSDKTVQSTTERTILKNLGSWLGNLTLARNKPIRHKSIAFKDLLIQGYDSNRLIVAIPFVCKVLEQCARSTIFAPPNPWLMAVLRLLVELYQFAELKLNLKFEIEVLCKSLNIDLKEVQSTTILRNRPQELAAQQLHEAQQHQLQQQRQLQQQQQAQQQAHQEAQQQPSLLQQQYRGQQGMAGAATGDLSQDLERLSMQSNYGRSDSRGVVQQSSGAQQPFNDTLNSMLQNFSHYIVFNPALTLFTTNTTLKRMVCAAIERAIREIINPVVERSVTIASISTRELIAKDFAMESDENKMRKAAHQMAQNLAGSLALVTCKEPLRISMVTHARTLLLQNGFTEQTLPEQAIMVIMQDNIDLACSIIERAAMEKALPDVDEGLASAYMARRDHRARGRGYYWDANALAQSQYASTLPDLLKIKPDGLQQQQLRVYEEFGKLPRAVGDVDEGAAAISGRSTSPTMANMPSEGGAPYPASIVAGVVEAEKQPLLMDAGAVLTPQQSLERFTQCMTEMDGLLQENDSRSQSEDVRQLARQIPLLAAQSVHRDETALVFSQKVVQMMYKSETDASREIYILLLERLCEVSVKVAKEVTAWLIYAEDERKFNVAVTVGLIRAGLINVTEQDIQLAKFLVVRDFKPSIVDYAAKLSLTCLKEPACATKQQLSNIIEALMKASQRGRATEASSEFLQELQIGNLQSKTDIESSQPLREQLAYCFAEWIRLFQHSPNAEKSFIDFVTHLQGQGILKGEEISSMFFRVCTEVGVDSYIKQKAGGGNLMTGIFQPIDAFSKLVVLMIKYHADPTGQNNEQAKVHYLTKILSIVVLVLAQSHEELGPHFQQKPFFRLFSSLLHDLHLAQSSLQGTYFQSLLAISNTLNTLQPSFFPSFTFSWISLISHRLFLPKLLNMQPETVYEQSVSSTVRSEGWNAYYRLFASLLRFLAPILKAGQLQETSRNLYKGTLRIVLVLLHDYPDFLANHCQTLNNLIPTSCIQLRNLILSSFPKSHFPSGLPDPFESSLAMTEMAEARLNPVVYDDYLSSIIHQGAGFKDALDEFLTNRVDRGFFTTLKNVVRNDSDNNSDGHGDGSSGFHGPLINDVVLHAGIVSLDREDNLLHGAPPQSDVGVVLVSELLKLDAEAKYMVAGAVCNQLRYPNRHTAYYSTMLLHLYTHLESAREAILRVLLERVIVNRPHPWGLLVTMFELLKDGQRYPLPQDTPVEIIKLLDHMRIGLGAVGNGAMSGGGAIGAADRGSSEPLEGQS